MTRAMVVFESLFGDAKTIACSIVEGLSERLPAEAVEAATAPTTIGPDIELLVVGGPNHQFGMPRPTSRQQAVRDFKAQVVPDGVGLREWLGAVGNVTAPVPAAAFDTRLDRPRFLGRVDHASRTAEKLLRQRGFIIVAAAEHFIVTSPTGPLRSGEQERARRWGAILADQVTGH